MTLVDHSRRLVRLARFAGTVGLAFIDYALAPRHRATATARALWLQRHCRRTLRALGVSTEVRGTAPAHAFVACNHVSYLDILVLAAQVPLVFVAKREVASWPVWGRLAQAAGTVFVDRTRRSDVARVGRAISALLEDGPAVALFPEGTSTDGAQVLPFKSALLDPAVGSARPAVPAAIAYVVPTPFSAALDVCWWGDMTLVPHLWRLLAIPHIGARVSWGEELRGASDRRQLAAVLQHAVAKQHAALRGESAAARAATPALAATGGLRHAG